MTTVAPLQGLPLHRSDPFGPPDGYAKARDEASVSPIVFPDGNQGWLLTRNADVKAMLANPAFSSVRDKAARTRRTESRPKPLPRAFFTMDPPDHTRYRRLATGPRCASPCPSKTSSSAPTPRYGVNAWPAAWDAAGA